MKTEPRPSAKTFTKDVARLIGWADKDKDFFERFAGTDLTEDQVSVLKAVVDTGGDLDALAHRLGALGMAWLARTAGEGLDARRRTRTTPGSKRVTDRVRAQRTAESLKAAANAALTFHRAKAIEGVVKGLEAHLASQEQIAARCRHAGPDAATWAKTIHDAGVEVHQTVGQVKSLKTTVDKLREASDDLAGRLDGLRGSSNGQVRFADHLRAARDAIIEMQASLREVLLG